MMGSEVMHGCINEKEELCMCVSRKLINGAGVKIFQC